MRSRDDFLLAMILAAAMAASLVVLVEAGNPPRRAAARQFQSMLGGFGMGCQVDLARCGWQFDPRIMGDEDAAFGSLVGLSEISPWHAIALFPMIEDDCETVEGRQGFGIQ
jgi:hypothetical protein